MSFCRAAGWSHDHFSAASVPGGDARRIKDLEVDLSQLSQSGATLSQAMRRRTPVRQIRRGDAIPWRFMLR